MASTTVRSGLFQTLNIIQDFSPQVIFNLHIGENRSQIEYLLVGQLADSAGWVDVEAGEEA